ncbi:GNAT family N-acetyltransferase [Lederbergia citrea]|uniref:GNAT family N-acetyltransferase n=1 Tax=Lederbergia citrea TaxID=2833581 RepID=UPI001BC95E9B|nr:GNAT family N-acetyltransferase [Lederbergia citrea]MBS4179361.1 GNAT family N-acetyltransferase [Lederbergia citrea]
MNKIEIRSVHNNEELEEVYELWGNVFPEDKSFFQERLELEEDYDYNTTWIAIVNGKIAAAVQIFPYFITFEKAVLKVGGIGNVATLPDYRGMSLTQTILKRQSEWMKSNGFDLSLLFTGINPFYEKIGWQTFPIYSQILRKSPEIPSFNYEITEFSNGDLEEIKSLYQVYCGKFVGSRIRSSTYWEAQLSKSSNFLIAKDENEVVAYLRYRCIEGNIMIDECCHDEGYENAVLSLLKETLVRNKSFDSIRMTFASNHVLSHYFQECDAEKIVETTNMWKIIDFNRLIEKLRDVFTNRIYSDVKENTILFQCGNSDILFTIKEGVVDIKIPGDSFAYNELVKVNEGKFISMLLEGIEGEEPLKDIFPKVHYNFWGTDSF